MAVEALRGWPAELLERDAELAEIDSALGGARAGAGTFTLIRGEPGVGKSRLLARARELAAGDLQLLEARGAELEREFSFGLAAQLFEPRLRSATDPERERLLRGSARLATTLFEQAEPPDPNASPYAMFQGLQWLVANIAEEAPVVLMVDDLHWADEPSLRFLAFLARRVAGLPVAVIATSRPVDAEPAAGLLAQLAAEPATRQIEPALLSAAAVARLVAGWDPRAAPEFAAACHEVTGGNPLLLRELLLAIAAEGRTPDAAASRRVREIGPAPVARAVYLGLRSLGREATDLARAVAVLGDDVPVAHAAALARLDPRVAARVAGALTGAGILARSDRLAYVHSIVRAAVYEELQPAERAVAHGQAAKILAATGEPVERIASHLLLAPPAGDPVNVETLRAAAALAATRGAPAAAVALLRRALEEPPPAAERAPLLLRLGRLEAAAGDPAAIERLAAARAAGGEPRLRAMAARELGTAYYSQGRFGDAVAAFDAGLANVADRSSTLAIELEAGWAGAALWDDSSAMPDVRARLQSVVSRAEQPSTPAERALLANRGGVEMLRGEDRDAAVKLALTAWDGGAMVDAGSVEDPALWAVTGTLLEADAWTQAEQVCEHIIAVARHRGAVLAHATACYTRGVGWLWRGRLAQALADAEVAIDARRDGWETFVPAAQWVRSAALLARGELGEAERAASMPPEEEERWRGGPVFVSLLEARIDVLLAQGRAAEVLEPIEAQRRLLDGVMRVGNPAFFGWRPRAALALSRTGELAKARDLAEEQIEGARRWGAPRTLGIALWVRGAIEHAQAGLPWLEEAVVVLEDSDARLERARTLVALGTALRVAGRRAAARDPLRAGLDLAELCGAAPLAARARDELVAVGGRPRRARLSGAEALTASERRVGDLAVKGLTNREIAEALFVTRKAVEFHLGNAYRKLDISGRDELADALAEPQL